ncbi:hypothetical protein PHYPSEUDO_009198 [Phytophthora pseudosyringae]|uniref:Uncharacterized protein n=1 Tax=Phytophthora pseudosyringae TaxID=221518 RepID=A0A8T1WCM1_9STRA|nr:hypothetical protein PHYPSEUDO_009198 [Phytophthora pseudosyringae]
MKCIGFVVLLLGSLQMNAVAAANVDCVASDWSAYSSCDEINMKQTRTREIVREAEGWGRTCPGLVDTITCVPVNCEVSAWGESSGCKATGYKTRARTVVQEAKYGGAACKALSEDVQCTPVDCYVSRWGDWSECLADDTRVSTRTILVNPYDGGAACPELTRSAPCSSFGSASGSGGDESAGNTGRR